tara:strand:- start:154 stop:1281 length:1128 start_codon:yes stop_codon:yes gene_type:complete
MTKRKIRQRRSKHKKDPNRSTDTKKPPGLKTIKVNIPKDLSKRAWRKLLEENNPNRLIVIMYGISEGIENLYYVLKSLKINLSGLKIENSNLDKYHGMKMADYLKNNKSITDLDLSNNYQGISSGINYILQSLNGNNTIRKLNLSGNDLNNKKILSLEDIENSNIKHLNLSKNNIVGTKLLRNFIVKNHSLETLNLENNCIINLTPMIESMLMLEEENKCCLKNLNVSQNKIKKLPDELSELSTLKCFAYFSDYDIKNPSPEVKRWLKTKEKNSNFSDALSLSSVSTKSISSTLSSVSLSSSLSSFSSDSITANVHSKQVNAPKIDKKNEKKIKIGNKFLTLKVNSNIYQTAKKLGHIKSLNQWTDEWIPNHTEL